MSRDLRALPKAHLHLHLEGGMRPSTMHELLDAAGLPPPREADGNFDTFISIYRHACEGLRSPADLARLVHEVVEDAANDGAVWIEPSEWITPTMAARAGLADEEAVLRVVLEALQEAARDTGIGAGLMVSTNRLRPPAEAAALARLAARYAGKGVVSFGLADNDATGPPEPFADAFACARSKTHNCWSDWRRNRSASTCVPPPTCSCAWCPRSNSIRYRPCFTRASRLASTRTIRSSLDPVCCKSTSWRGRHSTSAMRRWRTSRP